MEQPDPYFCTAWLVAAFVFAGALQAVWLYSRCAKRFSKPIDGGRTFRGKRIFGDNKTWRGFVVMVPAVGFAFLFLGLLRGYVPSEYRSGLWPISPWQYVLAGCWVGFAFMLSELPNSFLKRQLGVQPGQLPRQRWAKIVCFVLDQVDSIAGALLALSLVLPLPIATWFLVLMLGTVIHWLFNLVLFLLGAKSRAA